MSQGLWSSSRLAAFPNTQAHLHSLVGQALCHFLGSLMFRSCAYPPLSSLCSREYPINLQTRVWPLWVCVSRELVWGLSFWLENHLRRSPFSQSPAGPSPAGAPRVLAKESPAASSSNQVVLMGDTLLDNQRPFGV